MYNIGIDVHKEKCVVVIKGESPEVLKRTSFNNSASGIAKLYRLRSTPSMHHLTD